MQSLGLQGKTVQRVVARHGNATKEAVTKDPYHAMRGIKGMNLRWAASRDSWMRHTPRSVRVPRGKYPSLPYRVQDG